MLERVLEIYDFMSIRGAKYVNTCLQVDVRFLLDTVDSARVLYQSDDDDDDDDEDDDDDAEDILSPLSPVIPQTPTICGDSTKVLNLRNTTHQRA